MPSVRVDIISIGTLSRNRLWNETESIRTAHATSTLIRAGKRNILVDPGLPAPALAARLNERTGLSPDAIDAVFLTNFKLAHRAGLELFKKASKLIHENEQHWAAEQLRGWIEQAPKDDIDRKHMERELDLLESLKKADDTIEENIDLFPLFGYTPGTCGLLVGGAMTTTLIAGDAVPTLDHFLVGQVLPDTYDIKAAQESLAEAYEIADLIIPGHDNVFLNPRTAGM